MKILALIALPFILVFGLDRAYAWGMKYLKDHTGPNGELVATFVTTKH